jgi:hypothetical protein
MNTHASATLTALFFLWEGRRAWRQVLGFFILLLTRSFFVLTSYLSQIVWRVFDRMHLSKLVAVGAVVLVIVAFLNAGPLIGRDLTAISSYFTVREQLGYGAILEQVLSFDAYSWAFTLVPKDSTQLASNFINWAGNEVMYFTVIQQGGFILALYYFTVLIRRVRGLRVFVAVSMLHYGMATTPIVIFLLLQPMEATGAVRVRARRRATAQPESPVTNVLRPA